MLIVVHMTLNVKRAETWVDIVSNVIEILAVIFAIDLINAITRNQSIKASNIAQINQESSPPEVV